MILLELIADAVENGRIKVVEGLDREALDLGIDANIVLDKGMLEAMRIVGAKFQANKIFVPEMIIAARTMKKGVEVLKPYLADKTVGKYGKFIIGTVLGDHHDIGKNIVALMIESAGFAVIDLGIDVPAEKFIDAINVNPDCQVIGVSASLTTTMDSLKTTVQGLINAGCKSQVKIMVGGAPVTQEFANEIGADAYTPDAVSAAFKAVDFVKSQSK